MIGLAPKGLQRWFPILQWGRQYRGQQFADDVLSSGIPGLSTKDMRSYLEFVGDRRLEMLGLSPEWGSKNPFDFMELQGVQELTNFFERRVSAYQVGVSGEFSLEEEF